MNQKKQKINLRASIALIIVAAIWGIAGPVIKLTLRELPPFTFLFLRLLLSTIIMIPIVAYRDFRKQKKRKKITNLPEMIWLGTLGTTLTLGLFFVGYNHTTAIDAALIGILGPALIVIGGAVALKEEVTSREKLGLGLAMFGGLVTVVQPLLESGIGGVGGLFGNLLILLGNITWAAYSLIAKNGAKDLDPITLTAVSTGVGTISLLPLAGLEYYQNPTIINHIFTPLAVFGILYMAILAYVVAYFLYQWGLERKEASEVAVFSYLNPLFAFPVAVVFLGETVTPYFVMGGALITLGVILTEWKGRGNIFKR